MFKLITVGVVVAVAVAGLGWRKFASNSPPAPSAYSVQVASQMVDAHFQAQGSDLSLPYRLHVPKNLETGRKYPLVVFLHGAGENGDDNVRHIGPAVAELIRLADTTEPAFIAAPQSPWGRNWVKVPGAPYLNYSQQAIPESDVVQATRALVTELTGRYPIDADRLYVMGFSAGAAGSWDLLTRTSTSAFAAGAMLSGAFDPSRAAVVAGMPLWFFHGEQDTISPYSTALDTVQALRQVGSSPRYTLYPGVGHDTAEAALKDGVYPWLLAQRRSTWRSAPKTTP